MLVGAVGRRERGVPVEVDDVALAGWVAFPLCVPLAAAEDVGTKEGVIVNTTPVVTVLSWRFGPRTMLVAIEVDKITLGDGDEVGAAARGVMV
jgi:hypothetical protein